jgi:hypothetical protein
VSHARIEGMQNSRIQAAETKMVATGTDAAEPIATAESDGALTPTSFIGSAGYNVIGDDIVPRRSSVNSKSSKRRCAPPPPLPQ